MPEPRMTYARRWRTRSGADVSIEVQGLPSADPGDVIDTGDRMARAAGWEGHPGGWWRYLLADIGRWL